MDYEEGIKLGLDKFEIEDLPNMDTSMIAFISICKESIRTKW